jgi:ATP phosphoribosyltransferase
LEVVPGTQLGRGREVLRLALPSDGELHEPSLAFLRDCGIPVERASTRRYMGRIQSIPDTVALFQRTADITQKVEEGSADMGIVGLDRFLECHREGGGAILLLEDLGFGRCELVVAVPEAWVDVTSVDDLADLAAEFRQKGRQLRVATKYPRLVSQFFFGKGINYFTLVQASGTLEAAPAAGYADLIADIAASGTTLRENRLKTLEDGTILVSQACLIGNVHHLGEREARLALARSLLEVMEARLRAGSFYRLTANIRGESAEAVAGQILSRPEVAGLQGPTVSKVFSTDEESWFAVSLVVPKERLLEAVDHLRRAGGMDVQAAQVSYLFKERCQAYEALLRALGRG